MTAPAGPHVVILGAGFAGLAAARRLIRSRARVTVVDRHNYHLFQPLLHELAVAVLQPADIAEAVRRLLPPRAGLTVLMDEVVAIDRRARRVRLSARTLAYDHLVVALGADSSYFGNDHWRRLTFGLKTLDDATRLRHRLLLAFERAAMSDDAADRRRLLSFIVVGAGPSGVQIAAGFADFCRRALSSDYRSIKPEDVAITLIDAMPRILPGVDDDLAAYAARRLEAHGVRLLTDAAVEEVTEDGVLAGEQRIEAATVIWTAGVAAGPAAEWLGVEPGSGGKVEVAADLSLPDDRDVFLVGDNALVEGPDGKPLPGLAAVAKQQGRHAGEAIARRIEGKAAPGAFRYRDYGTMITLGRFAAIADFGRVRLRGFPAWLIWALVHVVLLLNARQRLTVMWNWLWAYVAQRPGARVIVSHQAAAEDLPGEKGGAPVPERETVA